MWTLEHFAQLRQVLRDDVPCLFTNYTRSTSVRATLLLAGFAVGSGAGVGEKSETTVASNHLHLLEKPLDQAWLARLQVSTNASPLRAALYTQERASDADIAALGACAQFR